MMQLFTGGGEGATSKDGQERSPQGLGAHQMRQPGSMRKLLRQSTRSLLAAAVSEEDLSAAVRTALGEVKDLSMVHRLLPSSNLPSTLMDRVEVILKRSKGELRKRKAEMVATVKAALEETPPPQPCGAPAGSALSSPIEPVAVQALATVSAAGAARSQVPRRHEGNRTYGV